MSWFWQGAIILTIPEYYSFSLQYKLGQARYYNTYVLYKYYNFILFVQLLVVSSLTIHRNIPLLTLPKNNNKHFSPLDLVLSY